jgi:proton-dependent oligopeptide transporter, POT family
VNPNADVDLLTSVDPIVVISCQILLAYLTRKLPAVQAIALGFLISGIGWVPLALHPSVKVLIFCLAVVALGEVIQASRYYEYCSRLAPEGQQGLYMGYAFLPIAIGNLIAGLLGGYLVHEFGAVLGHPAAMWWVVAAIGAANAGLMWMYGSVVKASPIAS